MPQNAGAAWSVIQDWVGRTSSPGAEYPKAEIRLVKFSGVTEKAQKVEKTKRDTPWYIEIPLVVVVTFLIMFLLQTFVGRLYVIPSASMEPTLHGCPGCTGDRIYVDKVTYRMNEPEPGDVVVFRAPESWNNRFQQQDAKGPLSGLQNLGSYIGLSSPDENDMVKRIVATGGQTISCQPGDPGIMVDGKEIDSSYKLQPPTYPVTDTHSGSEQCDGMYFGPIQIPADHYFVMGDNRTNSADSRYHLGDEMQGTVPKENVIGKVQAIVLPFNRIGEVKDYDIQSK